MKWAAFLLLFVQFSVSFSGNSADFIVAPNGNDAWSGKLAEPTADQKDGPFATLVKARDAARALRKLEPARKTPIEIALRGGMYYLAETLELSPEDSGTPESSLLFSAYQAELPIISGGTKIQNWKIENGRWVAYLPDVKSNQWNFSQLFVNEQRRMRPRLSKDSYYRIAGRIPPSPATDPKGNPLADDRFRIKRGELKPGWSNLSDIEVIAFHPWYVGFMRIKSIDDSTVVFTSSTHVAPSYGQLLAGMRYLVDNVKEAFNDPGEWYLDRPSGMLTYIPKPGESIETSVVIAPRIMKLVEIKGDPKGAFVQHIQFKNISFQHSNWNTPPDCDSQTQAAVATPGTLSARGARNILVENCNFTHLGTYGVEFEAACKQIRIEGCRFVDLGAGGIKFGTQGYPGTPEATSSDLIVHDNLIAHGGRIHAGAVGIWIGHAFNCEVSHNDIYDMYYTGITLGWSWGYNKTGNHDNKLEYNHIHDIGQEALSDMGAIYTLGIAPGSVLRGNVIHDISRTDYGAWGIYYDEGTSGFLYENNLIYRTEDGGFFQHYGEENAFINNIEGPSKEAQFASARLDHNPSPEWQKVPAYTFQRNIVYGWNKPSPMHSFSSGFTDKRTPDGRMYEIVDHNLYWNGGKAFTFDEKFTFDAWKARGYDANSIIADPLFENADKDDYRLKPNSPALALGFKLFDYSTAGRLKPEPADMDPLRWPRMFPKRPPPITEIVDSFDDTPVGQMADSAVTNEENTTATVRVTDKAAFDGRQSLMFTDGPGQKQAYNPHVYWIIKFATGTIRSTFALRMEKGAQAYHEWRTDGYPYHAGPSMTINANGGLYCREKKLGDVPLGQWIKFDIVAKLGDKADAKYDLTYTVQGQRPNEFKDLPCDPEFKSLSWFGFTSNATDTSIYYLDALSLKKE